MEYIVLYFSQDECSFVSLRDVERVMIVFRYFCEKKHMFIQEVLNKAQAEVRYNT